MQGIPLLTPQGLARSMCDDLDLAPPFSARLFADAVERRYNLRIIMEPWPSGEYTTGWCNARNGDYTIYYYAGGSVVQRERIQFHELCHILMGHLSGRQPPVVMRGDSGDDDREKTVEQVAQSLVAYSMLGDSPSKRRARESVPLSAYGQFIESLLER